jgi:hypothetical protein
MRAVSGELDARGDVTDQRSVLSPHEWHGLATSVCAPTSSTHARLRAYGHRAHLRVLQRQPWRQRGRRADVRTVALGHNSATQVLLLVLVDALLITGAGVAPVGSLAIVRGLRMRSTGLASVHVLPPSHAHTCGPWPEAAGCSANLAKSSAACQRPMLLKKHKLDKPGQPHPLNVHVGADDVGLALVAPPARERTPAPRQPASCAVRAARVRVQVRERRRHRVSGGAAVLLHVALQGR